jgi:2-dehydropantoate 2-reductase
VDGRRSQRLKELADILAPAGIKPRIREHIRDDIWLKLWGNAAFNPLSALTGAGVGEIAGHPETRPIVIAIMQEVAQVAGALGVNFSVDLETRIAWTEALGAHKTSMLQDLEAGRSLETDALGTVIQELAGLLGINTPNLNLILALLRRRAAHPLLTPSG